MPGPRKARYLQKVGRRDCDTPGCFDLHVDLDKVTRALAGNVHLDRICRLSRELTVLEVVAGHVPGAYLDPATRHVEINAGYDPAYDAGQFEEAIWELIRLEVAQQLHTLAGNRT